MKLILSTVKQDFLKIHGESPKVIVCAPGRINLIGEHTDYNDGFVFPAAIDREIYVAIGHRSDQKIMIFSSDLNDHFIANLDNIQPCTKRWANYVLGVVSTLQQHDYKFGGMNIVFGGDIPLGSGLSSSAALECATVRAINDLFDLRISKIDSIKITQQAENQFVGVQCGIMDMFASVMGRSNQAVRLDCRNLSFQYLPFDFSTHQLLLINTGVKHSLVDSEYNTRRAECVEGVEILKQSYPNINSLRDVSLVMIEIVKDLLFMANETVYKRCAYVCAENERVEQASIALQRADLQIFGALMYASHEGLQHQYDVSCKELDFLVDCTHTYNQRFPQSILGARMMGGGFGGCTLNLIDRSQVEDFILFAQNAYGDAFQRIPECTLVSISDGVRRVG
jgi:galactokinase